MITFKDFVPAVTAGPNIFGKRSFEDLAQTRQKMNEWIENEPNLKIINIETVVLPSIHKPSEKGSDDPELKIHGETISKWYQFFRVWYKTW